MADDNEQDNTEEESTEEDELEEGEESGEYDDDESEDGDDESEDGDDEEYDESEDDDDEEYDDEDDAEAEEAKRAAAKAAVAALTKGRTKKKSGRKKKKSGSTAGERLAAAKDRKRAKKVAAKEAEASLLEEEEELEESNEQEEAAASFLEKYQGQLLMVGAAVLAITVGLFVYQQVTDGTRAEASAALWDAVSTANAPLIPEEDAPEGDTRERYETSQARGEVALEEFRAVQANFAGTDAALFAMLGEGNALYDTGEPAEARDAYERALAEGGDRVDIAARALEGMAFTYEAEDNWDGAEDAYRQLSDIDHPEAGMLARLHLARVALHNEDEETAKEGLRSVLEDLREREDGSPALQYVRDQAELRLMAIDSSLVQRAPDLGGMGDLNGRSPEDIQRMIQEMMQQQQQQGQ